MRYRDELTRRCVGAITIMTMEDIFVTFFSIKEGVNVRRGTRTHARTVVARRSANR